MVLDYYNSHRCLNYTMKNKLSSVLIKHELQQQKDLKIDKLLFINLAKGYKYYKFIKKFFIIFYFSKYI